MKNVIIREEWRNVEGYEDKYMVSNFGRVKSLNFNVYNASDGTFNHVNAGRELKPSHSRKYPSVKLCNNGNEKTYSIHRLVATAFIEQEDENQNEVNHIDCNPKNNCIYNLEWCTRAENMKHAKENHLIKGKKGKDNQRSMKVNMIDIHNNTIIAVYDSIHEAARETNSTATKICAVCKGKRNTHNGYKWEYSENNL